MRRFLTAAALGLLATAGRAEAARINYTTTVVGSGSLGGTSFTGATIIITALAETNDVVDAGGGSFYVDNLAVSLLLNLAGGGGDAGNFTTPGRTFVTQADQTFAFHPATSAGSADVLGLQHADFGGYDLKSALSLSGATPVTSGQAFATSLGDLVITSTSGDAAFRADFVGLTPVPEPSSFALAVIGGLGLVGVIGGRRAK
jgi:hypothetical protein